MQALQPCFDHSRVSVPPTDLWLTREALSGLRSVSGPRLGGRARRGRHFPKRLKELEKDKLVIIVRGHADRIERGSFWENTKLRPMIGSSGGLAPDA